MLRQAASRLLGQVGRRFTTSASRLEGEAAPAGAKEFLEAWQKTAPSTLAPPELPTNFLPAEPSRDAAADGEKFAVNFYTPHETVAETKTEMIVLPGVEGYFGVKATHVPTIAQLKPGVLELHDGAEVSKYFISGGFAFVHPSTVTDVCVLEAAPLDQFDAAAVKVALQGAMAAAPGDDFEAAVNRSAQELFSALDAALESKA